MKAVKTCFPQATTLLCCRHLQERKMWRIKSAFQWKCGGILSGVSLVLRDLQAATSGRLLTLADAFQMLPDASGCFLI